MSDPTTLQKQREQQVQLTATQQLNQQRQSRTFALQNEQEVFARHEQHGEQILSRRAELYQMGMVQDMNLKIAAEQPRHVPQPSQLSEKERKKIAKKRQSNLKKAQRKHIPGATADSLPMMNEVRAFYKETAKTPLVATNFNFDARLFSPDFPEEQECSIDVKEGLTTLAKLKIAQRELDENPNGQSPLKVIATRANSVIIPLLENALRTVLAANGVDMDTGNAITDERLVEQAREMRAQAIAEYEKAMANASSTAGEEAEKFYAQPLQEQQAHILELDKAHQLPESQDLDFLFHYEPLQEEYVKTKQSIDSHPEQYAAHKDLIDRCYQTYLDANRRIADYGVRILALKEQAKQAPNKAIRDLLEKRAADVDTCEELDHLQSIATQQYETIRYLTEGRPFSENVQYMYKVLDEEYGIHSAQREQEKEDMRFAAGWNEGQQEVFRSLSEAQRPTTLRISREVSKSAQLRSNVVQAHETQLENIRKDRRALKILLHGAQVNETGAPLNVEEGRHMLEDEQRIQAYLSDDPAISGPLLAPVVEEVLNYPYLEADMEEELENHPAELHSLLEKNVYMQNMIQDHPEYFDTLPEETMERLKAAMDFGVAISVYVTALAADQGVEFNSGALYGDLTPVRVFRNSMDMYQASYEAAKAAYRQATGG